MSSEEPYNYLAIENGVNIIDCTSQVPNCPAKNMLSTDRKAIWLSCQGLPQGFTIDLSNQIKRPKLFSCFGFDCWHDYSSNPSMIELLASTDGEEFITWASIHPELRAGVQLFEIDPLATRYNYLKVVVRETYGAPKTYINQIFLFEENPLKKAVNTSKVNESINLNVSDAAPGRRSATMGDVHYNENFHETLGQRHTTGSHMKPKQDRRQSGNDFNFLQFYEQSKDEDVSVDQRNSLAKPPAPMGYSNSMPKLNQPPQAVQQHGNRGHPQTQRNVASVSYNNFPAGQFQQGERPGNISHDMINQDRQRNRRNSLTGQEYNQGPLTPQPKSSSGGVVGMISNQQKIYSNNPSPVLVGRNQHYLQDQFDSVPQSSKPLTPHDHPQNESFVSLLNDQITSMNDEVKKMVHNSGIKGGRDTYKPQVGTKSSTEEDDLGFPLLTHSEKEVKQMKIEMNKWSGMMMGLQENMSRLLQKVSDMQTGMDTTKTRSIDMLDTAKTTTENNPNFQSIQNFRKGSIESMPSTDSFETLRAKITGYLENVISQNQVIIQENQKLRQNMDSVRKTASPSKVEYNEASHHFSTVPQYNQDIEKIVSDVFEKNMKAWKKQLFNDMKSEIEERVNERINHEIERLHEEDQGFKEQISREMQELRMKVNYFEQQQQANMSFAKNTNLNLKSRSDKVVQDDVAPLKERKMNNQNASKENIDYYQNNVSMTTTAKKVSSSKDTTVDDRRQRKQPVVEIEKPSLNSSTTSLAKIQHLMEKLNEKIALRDQKVQLLQDQAEVSSIADSDILDTSKDELAESLFAQKARYNNNVSNRKKIMK